MEFTENHSQVPDGNTEPVSLHFHDPGQWDAYGKKLTSTAKKLKHKTIRGQDPGQKGSRRDPGRYPRPALFFFSILKCVGFFNLLFNIEV